MQIDRKYVALILSVAAIALAVFGSTPRQFRTPPDVGGRPSGAHASALPVSDPVVGAGPTRADIEALTDRRRATFSLDPMRLSQARPIISLLQPIAPERVAAGAPGLAAPETATGRRAVAYDPYVIESKRIGDSVEIYVPQLGLSLRGVVDDVEVQGDIVRWSGRFEQFNSTQSRFSLSQTMIDDYLLGAFETPLGSYTLEAKNGFGWIIEQAEGFQLPVDGKDYVESP